MDEWIYSLKNKEIKDEFQAKGLNKAQENLDIFKMTKEERKAYERYHDNLHYQAIMYESRYGWGKLEGEKEGREEGRKEEKKDLARIKIQAGEPIEKIAQYTNLSIQDIKNL